MPTTPATATPAELIADYALRALLTPSAANPLPRQIAAAIPDRFLEQWLLLAPLTPTDLRRVIEQSIHAAFREITR